MVLYTHVIFRSNFQDLVKSHLMNAVRNEMEELKEKIVKLEDTVNTLQCENEFLKSHASSETLSQLQQPMATAVAAVAATTTTTTAGPPTATTTTTTTTTQQQQK